MSRRYCLALVWISLMALPAWAQVSLSRNLVPTRSALGRLGLERQFYAAVPLDLSGERVIALSLAGRGNIERSPARVHSVPVTGSGFLSSSNLSPHDDFYTGAVLVFTGGALEGQEREIAGYKGRTREFTFRTPFPAAPAEGDPFEIKGFNEKITGTVLNGRATTTTFLSDTPLSPVDDFYVGSTLVFNSGELKGEARPIIGYEARTRRFTVAEPFASAPADGDEFAIRGAMLFIQTNRANLHAFDAETGQYLWVANIGRPSVDARGASVNANGVYVTNLETLYALDRQTGRITWTAPLQDPSTTITERFKGLSSLASSDTAADEHHVAVGLRSGKLVAFSTRDIIDPSNYVIPVKPAGSFLWTWKTNDWITSKPIFADKVVAFASRDSKLYVAQNQPPALLYRFKTGGPITGNIAAYGTRTVLVPSADHVLYAVDLFTGDVQWQIATGAPLSQEPLVAGDEVYVVNDRGMLFSLDARSGQVRWSIPTGGGKLLAVGRERIYLESRTRDLFIVSRANGAMLADPRMTLERAGLNLRDYSLSLTNNLNDRIYLITSSGSLLCLREMGQVYPRPNRDPKLPHFGYIPPEGEATPPQQAPAPEGAPEA
ncbi:MAG: PQQ-binding-like beta-propeller repeat protein, partial [Isosphaeraceae bacterium]|nr:PQQ-binding-like beta-propeller repeat protein [Isosphaeraceae bacterium]